MRESLQAQLINDLVAEGNEALDQFDQELLLLEKEEVSDETLNVMFRVIHTLKGSGGCLGLRQIESLAHAGESLMSLLREHQIAVTSEIVTLLLACSDGLRAILSQLQATGAEGTHDNDRLIHDLKLLSEAQAQGPTAGSEAYGLFDVPEVPEPENSTEQAYGLFDWPPAENSQHAFPVDSSPSSACPAQARRPASQLAAAETVIRVDVEQLDCMMDLVGELVLARNQILQSTANLKEPTLTGASQRLNIITTKLQETVMKTRMQPIGNVWNKFPRIIRDVARDLGKQVRIEMEGKDTDLDRNILEAIKDPLTHLVRNAIDHGLESPEKRLEAGKSAEGVVRLRAFHEGGQVNIEIYDDGAGIHREKVLQKALQRNLIQPAVAAGMSDSEIYSLLFLPGFSTAEKVTNLSGRGVGLDVVKNNIERVGGSVIVHSEPGRSTLFRIRIPLTLAIIPALIVSCGSHCYAIPQVNLVELVRIDGDQRARAIEQVSGAPVYRLRGNLLPLLYLSEQLKIPARIGAGDQSLFVLILQAEGLQFGLVVDAINDTEEIVVKPLGKELKNLAVYAGATIMGDGRVSLILDILALARRAGVVDASRTKPVLSVDLGHRRAAGAATQSSTLLFSLAGDTQAAIGLSNVARLEEFEGDAIEAGCDSDVIQYRGEIMPLIDLSDALGLKQHEANSEGRVKVIVYGYRGKNVGLIVHRILDTVEGEIEIQKMSRRPGSLGSAVVRKRVTEFIDVDAILERSGLVCREMALA
jgi:two-component system chemotaxis sensor kinase CheA